MCYFVFIFFSESKGMFGLAFGKQILFLKSSFAETVSWISETELFGLCFKKWVLWNRNSFECLAFSFSTLTIFEFFEHFYMIKNNIKLYNWHCGQIK